MWAGVVMQPSCHLSCQSPVPAVVFPTQFPANVLRHAMSYGPTTGVPSICRADQSGVPSSWPLPGPALTVAFSFICPSAF